MPCYGYDRPTAPALCELAREGVLFENIFTPRTQTTPAIASLFTGLHPHRHGVRHLGQILPSRFETIAEQLSQRGYATGAFVSSFIMVRDFSGLDQGFDVYDDVLTRREPYRDNYERSAEETVSRALQWLRTAPRRAFLFVHMIEPHGPYTPESKDLARFARRATIEVPLPLVPPYQRIPGLGQLSQFVARYDGEIALADAALARLLAGLRELGRYEQATLVVTSDHGESFGEEERWLEHGASVGPAEAHVPLVVRFAPREQAPAAGLKVSAPLSLVEVFATLRAEAGLEERSLLRELALDPTRTATPPLTERTSPEGLELAAYGPSCWLRYELPSSYQMAGSGEGWRSLARRGAEEGDPACLADVDRGVDAPVRDRIAFRRDFPVARSRAPFQPGFPTRFLESRGDPVRGLPPEDRERLRALGYLDERVP